MKIYFFFFSFKKINNLSPIHIVCFNGNIEILNLLLLKDINVNIPNLNANLTPLHIAVQSKNLEIIKILLNLSNIELNVLDAFEVFIFYFILIELL